MKTKHIGIYQIITTAVFFGLFLASSAFSQTVGSGKPTIAVIQFAATGKATPAAGIEITDLLVNELVNSNRFRVVDRSTAAREIDAEIMAGLTGAINPATAATIGNKTGAQFMVIGNVTEFREKPGFSIGPVASYEATVKFNLRIVNTTTAEIVFSQNFEKKASAMGAAKTNGMSGNFESKAMQDAVGKLIKEATALIVEKIGSAAIVTSQVPTVPTPQAVCSQFTGAKSPRIMVVIPEIHITQKIPDPAGETEIIKKLVAMRFNVVDQSQVAAIRDREKVLAAVKNPAAAAALGIEFGADIIIVGEAFSELASRQGNMITTRARVEARAIQTDNARILAADGKFGSGLDIAEFVSAKAALRNAGSQWADYFIEQICRMPETSFSKTNGGTQTQSVNTASVEIMIANINFNQLKQFGDRLAKIPGVRGVEKKLTGNVARIDVQFDGTAEKLADAISETKFGLMRVNIVGLSGSKIEISLGK